MTADVQISMDDKQLIFQCKDTGIGMDKDFLQHLYEPYVRKENDVHEIAGTGLGMAITHKLIDLMKGAMEVESRIGVGTNIRITLPIRLADGEEDKVSYDVRQTFGEIRYVEEFLGISENIFTYNGKNAHELILFYNVDINDSDYKEKYHI